MPSITFSASGWHRWDVPNGVEVIEVELKGAGAPNGGSTGTRRGGHVAGRMRVHGVKTLFVGVGEQGQANSGTTPGQATFGGGGAGGKGRGTGNGGRSGGGASFIRIDDKDGRIRAVAGGCGGRGHNTAARGGLGGADRGENGYSSPSLLGLPTGGSQNQGGAGGNSSQGREYDGRNGESDVKDKTGSGRLGRAGRGGEGATANSHGGGGGGGGYYPGGGGFGGVGQSSGGAGGSNFDGGIFGTIINDRGDGSLTDGEVTLTWDIPGGNTPPTAPSDLTLDSANIAETAIADGLATKATSQVVLRGHPNDPDFRTDIRLFVRLYEQTDAGLAKVREYHGDYDDGVAIGGDGKPNPTPDWKDKVVLDDLDQDTRYYLRVHTQEKSTGRISVNYTSTNFWTNRSPAAPELLTPLENAQFSTITNITFTWNHVDPDPSDSQTAYRFRYRKAATPTSGASAWDWTYLPDINGQVTSAETITVNAPRFQANVVYEWTVSTRDEQGRWGPYAIPRSFTATGTAMQPRLIAPINNEAFPENEEYRFKWKFLAQENGAQQVRADLRYRVVGSGSWITLTGDVTTPGADQFWDLGPYEFDPQFRYEWQVRTYSTTVGVGEYSDSSYFHVTKQPGNLNVTEPVDSTFRTGGIGQGINRAYVYERGGARLIGEIRNTSLIRWHRKRDDISGCDVWVEEWDVEDAALFRKIATWRHEVVVFRTNEDGTQERVWEGPITRISGSRTRLEIEAKDVMAYPYRRIMRQGYTDSFQIVNGEVLDHGRSVVKRSVQILLNCLAYDDPNVIDYITPVYTAGDARSTRTRRDYSRTAWEEIDDLAAVGGLDYVTVGRRIVLNDTHVPIGKLPEMGDADFSNEPIITEYGMSAANYFAVTNGQGIWGASYAQGHPPTGDPASWPEGWLEQLASAYGDTTTSGNDKNLTREQQTELQKSFREQAYRNIAGRYPVPIIVRVPDNSTLSPNLQVGINQLVPGVWIPLRANNGIREIAQWQKLDSMTVEQTSDGEKITVVMSPAPNEGQDPDADAAAVEE